MFFTTTIPAFFASDAIIGTLALIGWIFIVAAIVWLGEKAIEKFLRRTATRAKTLAPSSEATGAPTREPEQARAHAHHQKHPSL
jgi:hypothetical protein